MSRSPHKTIELRRLAYLLLATAIASQANAEDDGWLEIKENKPANANQFMVQPENFAQWVFQGAGNEKEQRKLFDTKLDLSICEIDGACKLSNMQEQRLRLAGELDIDRFLAVYHRIRREYLEKEPDQEAFNQIWQDISPLQQQVRAGLVNDGSLLRKTSRQILNEGQSKLLARTEQDRRECRYRAAVEMYFLMLDNTVPLQAVQREGLIELVIAKTKPPNISGQQDQLYLQCQLAQVTSDDLRSVIRGEQLKLLQKLFRRGKNYENHLRRLGIHPHDE